MRNLPSGDQTGSMEYSDTRESGESPFRKMRVRRGSPSRTTADTMDWPSGAQAGLPCNLSESARTLTCVPSLSIMYNSVLPLSSTEKAMRRPSGEEAGPPTTRDCPLLQTSRWVPCVSDQIPCLSPRHDTYNIKSGPSRGATPFVKTSDGALAVVPAVLSSVRDMRQILARELAIVAARRMPLAEAASDV